VAWKTSWNYSRPSASLSPLEVATATRNVLLRKVRYSTGVATLRDNEWGNPVHATALMLTATRGRPFTFGQLKTFLLDAGSSTSR
jgi:hypothetical protein